MTVRYLLPCSCGQAARVEACQAGQTVACPCGATLEVPTMLKLVKLPRVDPEPGPSPRSPSWGLRQRLTLVGVMIILAALTAAFYLYWNRPRLSSWEPTPELIRQQIEALSPVEVLRVWQVLRRERLDRRNPADNPVYVEAVFRYRLALGVAFFFAASGGGLILASLRRGVGPPPRRGARDGVLTTV